MNKVKGVIGMYCKKCGSLMEENAKYCAKCGSSNQDDNHYEQHNTTYYNSYSQAQDKESRAIGILAIICSILFTGVGLIISIVGLCMCKSPENRANCKIGLGISITLTILEVILAIIIFWIMGNLIYGYISY